MRILLSVFLALFGAAVGAADKPILTVYTYDSFTSEWGPGPAIARAFEARCECELRYVAVDGSTGILSRVLLEGAGSRADVVLGLDTGLMAAARRSGLLAPHGVNLGALDVPFPWDDPVFLPFDYGYFAFIYDAERLAAPPTSMRALVEADDSLDIVIQDPRSSTPGLGLLLWMKSVYGDEAGAAWERLEDNIVTVTAGWSEAYGMFLEGEADMVLSYTTSPAYHMVAEGKHQYRAAAFSEGHGMQIEAAARLAGAAHPQLAEQFMQFIAGDDFQSVIPTHQWMYPVKELPQGLPEAYGRLVQPQKPLLMDPEEVDANKARWVDEFSAALRR